jgi:hypothetical protein
MEVIVFTIFAAGGLWACLEGEPLGIDVKVSHEVILLKLCRYN